MGQNAAQSLWKARLDNDKLTAEFEGAPFSETDAYAIQNAMIALSGRDLCGWKLGATNAALQAVLDIERPFLGPLLDGFIVPSGSEVTVRDGDLLETEIAVKLGADLPSKAERYSAEEVRAATAAIVPCFEIAGARFSGPLAGAGFRVIADGGINVAAVMGDDIRDFDTYDLADIAISMSLDGKQVQQAHSSALYWDSVFEAVSWALAQPSTHDRGLRAGDLILTGTLTGVIPLDGVGKATATLGALGDVTATFRHC